MPVKNVLSKKENVMSFLFWAILIVSVIVVVFLPVLYSLADTNITFIMVAVMIFGVIAFLAVLTLAGKVFIDTHLACKEEALGLPSGSVRAIIALSLIIIFAMISIFLYTQISPQGLILKIPGNETVVLSNGTALANPNGIHIITEPTQAQKDFATQTLSTVSTLVVALTGFYFGSKVATSDKKTEKPVKYSLSINLNGEVEKGNPIVFGVDVTPKNADVQLLSVDGDSLDNFKKNDGEFIYTPSAEHKNLVKAIFAVKSDGEIKATAEQTIVLESLEVTSKLTEKVSTGQEIAIEFKAFSYEDKEPKVTISGDDYEQSVNLKDLKKGKFIYKPTKKGSPRNNDEIHLTIKLDTKPPLEKMVKIEVVP